MLSFGAKLHNCTTIYSTEAAAMRLSSIMGAGAGMLQALTLTLCFFQLPAGVGGAGGSSSGNGISQRVRDMVAKMVSQAASMSESI